MKNWSLLFMLFFSNFIFALPIQEHKIDSLALSELTSFLGIDPDADLIKETQKLWLRKPGQERWEMEELSTEKRQFVLDWAKKQGFFSPWAPSCENYDKALILGATTSRMQMRLDYLKKLWLEGIRFNEVVWLTGDRPLDPREDALTDLCKTESEAARILWEKATLPDEMKNLPALFIAAPMKKEGSSLKRPNTEDTIIAWIQNSPQPCKALFISDQPFCGYQFAVVKKSLPEPFEFDVAGEGVPSANHPSAAAITLDSIARWLYLENLSRDNNTL